MRWSESKVKPNDDCHPHGIIEFIMSVALCKYEASVIRRSLPSQAAWPPRDLDYQEDTWP